MKIKYLFAILAMFAIFNAEAKISVGNVVCKQQYPWNGKVTIDYEVTSDDENAEANIHATGFDYDANQVMEVLSVTGNGVDGPVKPGKHSMVWDVTTDYPGFNSTTFSVRIATDTDGSESSESRPIRFECRTWAADVYNASIINEMIIIEGGRFEEDAIWEPPETHLVFNSVYIPSGVTLTIVTNTVVKFCEGTFIKVEKGSKLNIVGTEGGDVILTAANDNTVGEPIVGLDPKKTIEFPGIIIESDEDTYTVNYNANGGEGEMKSQVVAYGMVFNLSSNTFTRTYYKYTGWATNETGSVVYSDGETVSNLTSVAGGVVDLYAVWKSLAVQIKVDLGGSETNLNLFIGYPYGELPVPADRKGWTFVGWFTEPDGTGRQITENSIVEEGDDVLYQYWEKSGALEEISCFQAWPFDRRVIINYTIGSEDIDENTIFNIKFLGTLDRGLTYFNLSELGKLSREGETGTVIGAGKHKTLWAPDESMYDVIVENMQIKIELWEVVDTSTCMTVDLGSGKTSYLNDISEEGWTNDYKTTKLVLRKIEPGSFTMGSQNNELGRSGNDPLDTNVIISKTFKFDGSEIEKDNELLLSCDDPIAFSTALVEGNPVSLKITVEDENAIDNTATLYWDDSGEEVEGMFCWDYDADEYHSFSYYERYLLKETIVTDLKTNIFTRTIMLVPEPAGLVLLFFIATVVWLKREVAR